MYDSRAGLRYQGSRQAAVVSRMPKAAGGLWAVVDTSTSAWGTAGRECVRCGRRQLQLVGAVLVVPSDE
jgi:hypothetical protein